MVYARLEKIQVGQCLFDFHQYQTNIRDLKQWGNWPVYVIEIDLEKRRALCSWNGNKPKWYSEDKVKKLRLERGKKK